MKVLDILNFKWYEKEDLIKESYKIFLKDLHLEDGFETKEDMQKEAMNTAKEYVKENAWTMEEVARWVKDNI